MNKIERYRRIFRHWQRERRFSRDSGVKNFKFINSMKFAEFDVPECFHSQCGQDWFIATYIFPDKVEGFFVDVGANHPEEISNSLYFEQIGWKGVAFEPQKELCELWPEKRSTPCFPILLGDTEKDVPFQVNDAHTLSGVVEDKKSISDNCVYMRQRRLDQMLIEKGVSHIDVLMIDVEGYEMNVLDGMDFSKINVECVVLENDATRFGDPLLRQRMVDAGFKYIARLMIDDVFVKIGGVADKNYQVAT